MAIFKKKKLKAAAPPEEEESPEELEADEEDDEEDEEDEDEEEYKKMIQKKKAIKPAPTIPEYKEIPVCLSQAQINNIIIENNIMLKQILSEIEKDV